MARPVRAPSLRPDPIEGALVAVAWALVAVTVGRLWGAAAGGVFATDECFHAAASEAILRTRGLPVEFPQFYSGFFYYYPPLFHVIGAVWIAAFGLPALHVLPAAIFAATLLVLAGAGLRLAPAASAAAAALVVCAHPSFQVHATKLYVDGLVALLVLAAALLVVAWWRRPGWSRALALGAVLGLALLAKFNAWLPVVGAAGAAALASRPGSPRPGRQLWAALGIAVALAAPLLVRNQQLYGSALYPLGAPDLDGALYALNRARFSTPLPEFYAALPRGMGPVLGALVLAAGVLAARRRHFGPWETLLAFSLASLLILPLSPYAAERHLLPFLLTATISAAASCGQGPREGGGRAAGYARGAVLVVALAAAVLGQATFSNPRRLADLPPDLHQSFTELAGMLDTDDLVLSLWTYDTAYYSGARATWPNPWGQRHRPSDLFDTDDPDTLAGRLARHGIGWVLVPARVRPEGFNSANYPERFVACLNNAQLAGRLTGVWRSERLILLRVDSTAVTR